MSTNENAQPAPGASELEPEPRAPHARVEVDPSSVVIAGALLAVGGWSGLIWLIGNTLPTVGNRWAFFALLHIALTGSAMPIVQYLSRRFARRGNPPLTAGVLVRQSIWVGLFGTICAWVRIPRLLSVPLAIVLLVALTIIESVLRWLERTQWLAEQR